MEKRLPPQDFDTLREYGKMQLMMHGASATKFAVGPGLEGMGKRGEFGHTYRDPYEFSIRHNSGQFPVRTLQPLLPPPELSEEFPLHDICNFFGALDVQGGGCSYKPPGTSKKKVSLVASASDGMMIKHGGTVSQAVEKIFGPVGGPIALEEAKKLDDLPDRELRQWIRAHPFANEAVEIMLVASDNSVAGHLGFSFQAKGGRWQTVRDFVEKMAAAYRVCGACLRWCYDNDLLIEDAQQRCDAYCTKCMAAGSLCSDHLPLLSPEQHVKKDLIRKAGAARDEGSSGTDNAARFEQGDQIEARFGGKGKWFSGRVTGDHGDGTYDIQYEDEFCRPLRNPLARTHYHFTHVVCTPCQETGCVCHSIWCLQHAMDCCGPQAAWINRCTCRVENANTGNEYEAMADAIHTIKSIRSSTFNWFLWIDGHLVGMRVLLARYHDADPVAQMRLRCSGVSRYAQRNRNKFSIETAIEVNEEVVQVAMLSESEWINQEALMVITVGPEPYRYAQRHSYPVCTRHACSR